MFDDRFEPAQYSIPELHFFLEHLGKPPAVIMRLPMTEGMIARRVEELVRKVYELDQIRAAEDGFSWAGVEALTGSITRFLEWHDRSREIQRRGAKDASGAPITHPSQYTWDEDGRAYKFAVGSDSAEMVRTEILEDGSRRPFGVNLLNPSGSTGIPDLSEVAPWVKVGAGKPRPIDQIEIVKHDSSALIAYHKCSVCGFQSQFKTSDRGSQSLSTARMHRHLKTAKENINRHRILLNKVAH